MAARRAPRANKHGVRSIWIRLSALQKAMGLGRDDAEELLRDLVHDVSEQGSTRSLSGSQVHEVLRRLDEHIDGARKAQRKEKPPARDALVSPQQSRALLDLADALDWSRDRLRAFITKRMHTVTAGRPWPQTRGEAIAIHEALEAMVWRLPASSPKAVVSRCESLLGQAELTDWERGFLTNLAQTRRGNLRGPPRLWKPLCKLAEIERKAAT